MSSIPSDYKRIKALLYTQCVKSRTVICQTSKSPAPKMLTLTAPTSTFVDNLAQSKQWPRGENYCLKLLYLRYKTQLSATWQGMSAPHFCSDFSPCWSDFNTLFIVFFVQQINLSVCWQDYRKEGLVHKQCYSFKLDCFSWLTGGPSLQFQCSVCLPVCVNLCVVLVEWMDVCWLHTKKQILI